MDTYLVAVGDLILAVEIVPDVYHTVHPGHEKHPSSSRAETPARQVRAVVLWDDRVVCEQTGAI